MQQAAVLALLGEACLAADRLDEAAAVAHRVLALARERSQRGDEAAALRLLGEIAGRTPGETETAVRHYQAAIALTGELGMRPLLARSHLGLGRLWLGIGPMPGGPKSTRLDSSHRQITNGIFRFIKKTK